MNSRNMATSIENVSLDYRAESSSGNCLDETEDCKPDWDGPREGRKHSWRKRRILYDREFLIKCFHSPASTRKPNGFPIPNLDCTLGASKVKRLPLTTHAPAPVTDWSRRRNGAAQFPRERDYGIRRRYSNDRERHDEKEPEWFSGGPSSQHETIELRGFLDDDRREKSDERRNGAVQKEIYQQNGEEDSSGESTKNDNACESPMDLSIEKILKMDHIPGILTNDLLEAEEPSGSSRFSQFFMRNSATPDPGQGRTAHHHHGHDHHHHHHHENNAPHTKDKSKAAHEMGELLRNMLIKKSSPAEPSPEPKVKEAAKPPPNKQDDVDAFKKLITPLLEKVLQGPATQNKMNSNAFTTTPSSMAFTPTSVMRKMTAEGGKPPPPRNQSGFVPPVPISGGLLPTPPNNTAPVMLNSNSPNLASLMSNMGRPPPQHMQFRPHPQAHPPPPMGYPPNPGFHPNMMPPNMPGPGMIPPQYANMMPQNMHGPGMIPPQYANMMPPNMPGQGMLPPQYANMIPNQAIYNKSEEY